MKKKILIIKEDYRSYGGINNLIKNILPLLEKKYEIHFISLYSEIKGEELSKDLGYKINYILNNTFINKKNIFFELYKLILFAYKIKGICKKKSIDIIWSHGEFANFSSILSKVLFRNKKRLFSQLHTNPSNIGIKYQKVIKVLYNYTDNLLVDSQGIKDILISNFNINERYIHVVETFINFEILNKKKNIEIDNKYIDIFNGENFVFITVARLVKLKNQEGIINAFNNLGKTYKNISLVFIGKGDKKYENKLIKLADNNTNIHFLGLQKNVFKYLNKSNCFVLNSLWEGFPVALLEAMGLGLPVICSAFETGSKELLFNDYNSVKNRKINDIVIGDNGILIPIDDEYNLFIAMKKLLNNTDLQLKLSKSSSLKSIQYDVVKYFDILDNMFNHIKKEEINVN